MTAVKIAEGQFYRVLKHDTGDWAIEGIENIRSDISQVFTRKEAADFFEFEFPLYQARYMVDRKCREILAASYDEDELGWPEPCG